MPRDGSGVYTLPVGNPVVTNTVIASTWANATMSDIAAQLNNVFTRDGLLGPTAPFKIVDGTVAAPGLAFNSEPGLGWYRPSAGVTAMATGGAQVASMGGNATDQFFSIFPRTAGVTQFTLHNNPAGTAQQNQLYLRTQADMHLLGQSLIGGAAAKPLRIDFGTINLNGATNVNGNMTATGAVQGSALRIAADTYWSQDASSIYINMAPNWFFAYNKSTGNLQWNHGPAGPVTSFSPGGDFTSAGNVFAKGGEIGMVEASSERYLRFNSQGWRLRFLVSDGDLAYLNNASTALIRCTAAGDFTARNHCLAENGIFGLVVNGSFPYIKFTSDNWRLQMNRSSGDLQWVNPGGTVLQTLGGNGDFATAASVQVGNVNSFRFSGSSSFFNKIGLTLRDQQQSGAVFFINGVDAEVLGMRQIISFQHQSGVFAHIQFQVGSGIFNFTNGGLAQKSGAGGQWDPVSDARFKTNVRPLEYGLPEILQLDPVMFDMIDGAPDNVGIIAQDAMRAMPRIAYLGQNPKRELLDAEQCYFTHPDYIQFALINATKELHERLSHLEAQAAGA